MLIGNKQFYSSLDYQIYMLEKYFKYKNAIWDVWTPYHDIASNSLMKD